MQPINDGLDLLTLEAFQPRIGARFRIYSAPDASLGAELIEARSLGDPHRTRPAATRGRAPFALLFRTSDTRALPQRIYRVEHDDMGAYDIFLVPVGPDGKGMVYEAVFT